MMVPTSSTPVGTSYFSICSRRIEAISFGWSLNSLLRWSPGGHCVATGAGPRGGRARTGRPCGRARARSRRRGWTASTERSSVTSWPLASASLERMSSASASAIGTAVVSSSSSWRRARRSASCTTATTSASASRRLLSTSTSSALRTSWSAPSLSCARICFLAACGKAGLKSTPESSRLCATASPIAARSRATSCRRPASCAASASAVP